MPPIGGLAPSLLRLVSAGSGTVWSATRARLFHYRTAGGAEVDLVLERADGRLVAIEVKASERLEPRDLSGIRALAADAGRRFVRGVVLYLGRDVVPFDRAIHAVPITALWRMGATGRRGVRAGSTR